MEDIVAVELELDNAEKRYFLTWGRIQHRIDPAPLEALILRVSPHFSIGGKPVRARLCATLHEAAGEPFFFEYFFAMCQKKIPFGPRYDNWRAKIDRAMNEGKEICFLGRSAPPRPP
jgi:hypothetical protein